jgi:hypothetical protein
MFATRRTATHLALASALGLLAAPVAMAQQDLRNPDNRPTPHVGQDLRMPDRQAPQPPPSQPRTYRDLRSADARDDRRVVTIAVPSEPSAEPGFDFGDAAIGAGIIGALTVLGGTAAVTVRRRGPAPAH